MPRTCMDPIIVQPVNISLLMGTKGGGTEWEKCGEQGAFVVDTTQPGHDLDCGGPLRGPAKD